MARHSKRFNLIVEQAEDEISAINMAIGAWYAGGRALVNTSGGGFALMEEAVSLAGVSETPLVIHVAQRVGPATGMPTRTEQADLFLTLHAGHGEFPRVIYAPGNVEEAFNLTRMAFHVADRYQIPVFILTDHYLMDTYYNMPEGWLDFNMPEYFVVEADGDYMRYLITESGVSPRGIPGWGKGLIRADSHEHDEEGYITEDPDIRMSMALKRMRKDHTLREIVLPPSTTFTGEEDYLVVCWGSTKEIVKEAVEKLGRDNVAFMHLAQVYPLHEQVVEAVESVRKVICVENNITGQLATLLAYHTARRDFRCILKFDGRPFSVEEVTERLEEECV